MKTGNCPVLTPMWRDWWLNGQPFDPIKISPAISDIVPPIASTHPSMTHRPASLS